MDLCFQVQNTLPQMNRWLVRNGLYDRSAVQYSSGVLNISEGEAVSTMCGITASSLIYLFNMREVRRVPITQSSFNPSYAYMYDMRGVDSQGNYTVDGHMMTLFHDGRGWMVIDSYIVCRTASCRYVNLSTLQQQVLNLSRGFNLQILTDLTGCVDPSDGTTRFETTITEYSYDRTAHIPPSLLF